MRSTADDQTLRSRIRNSAIALFGAHGADAVSVRRIAAEAGVSPALVIHHFGSKDGLRAECDEHIVEEVLGRKRTALEAQGGDLQSAMQRWLADVDAHRPSLDYLARMIADGSPAGDRLFDDLLARTEAMLAEGVASGRMRPSSDPRMTAVLIAMHGLLPLLLERHLGRALGETGLTPVLVRRMTIPTLELYTHGLYADDALLQAASAALAGDPETARGPRSDKGAGDPNQDPDPPRPRASDH